MSIVSNRLGLVVVASALTLVGCGGSDKPANSPASSSANEASGPAEVGKAAPALSVEALNGKGRVSLDDLKGKVVIVDFWATWCAPCKQSFPKLDELSKKLGDTAEIIGISVDDEVSGVAEFAKANGATFPIAWDEGHAIADRWGNIGTMPTTFVVDTEGKVRFIHSGYKDGETDVMAKEAAMLLAEAGSPKGSLAASEPAERVAENEAPDVSASEEEHAAEQAPPQAAAKKAGKRSKRDKAAKGKKSGGGKKKAPKKGGKRKK